MVVGLTPTVMLTSADVVTVLTVVTESSEESASVGSAATAAVVDTVPLAVSSSTYEMVRALAVAPPANVPASSVQVRVGDGDAGVQVHPVPVPDENVVSDGRSHVTASPVASLGPALATV